MDISNSLVTTGFQPPLQNNQIARPDTPPVKPVEKATDAPRKPAEPEALERKSKALLADRLQRVDSLDAAPLRAQQAVNTYQQTVAAGQEYEQGELVGVDLFV
jgi:hypothetical protein